MKTTAAACLMAALLVAAETASHAAEGVKQGAVVVKDKTNSWVGWAYRKFTESMVNKASQGKDVAQETSDSARYKTGQTIKLATDKAETAQGQATEKMPGAMAYGKEKASNVQDGAKDTMHKASDKLRSAYESAKEKAGMAAGDTEESYNDMSRHAKESYEAAKERASQAAGDIGEEMKEGKSEL